MRADGPLRCGHCGSPLVGAEAASSGFCCHGCAYIHRLIAQEGLGTYYRIKDAVTPPADASVFQPRDYGWLDDVQGAGEASARDGVARADLSIQGISCAGCIWLVERLSGQQRGLREARANAGAGTIHLRWTKGAFSLSGWARRLQGFGYLVGPAGDESGRLESEALARRIGLCAAFAMNVMLFTLPTYFGMRPTFAYASLFRLLALLFATMSVLAGGSYFFSRALAALRARQAHIDLPIAIGIAGAYAGSLYGWCIDDPRYLYFDFVATFTLLMLTGRWVQIRAVEHNRRRLLRSHPAPMRVRLLTGESVSPHGLRAGQEIELSPGQVLPVDAVAVAGRADFSLASINGEPDPVTIENGGRVSAGAVNIGLSSVRLRTLESWSESLLAQLQAAPEALAERSRTLERIVGAYVIGILVLALLAGLAWAIAGRGLVGAGSVSIAVLVVSCPCAIGLALPLAEEMATVAARARGVFVRNPGLWSRLRRVRVIAFDKTGTLTLEVPRLLNPSDLHALKLEARHALAGLVQGSLHPVGAALRENLASRETLTPSALEVEESPGQGVRMGPWTLGRAGWRDSGPSGPETVLARDGIEVARFSFSDALRPHAAEEVAELARMGYEIHILSGDASSKVAVMALHLGLPGACAHGGLSPAEKAEWIDRRGRTGVLMLGDGINDSLAFDRALCRGTPVVHRGALEGKADFYYLQQGLEGIRALIETDSVLLRTRALVVGFSLTYNVLAAGFAAAGLINPLAAAVLMPLSSIASLLIVALGMRAPGGRVREKDRCSAGMPAARDTGLKTTGDGAGVQPQWHPS